MKAIKVLSWCGDNYLKGILKKTETKINVICKDTVDFGLKGGYHYDILQCDIDKILHEYQPDIIVMNYITSRNLPVELPATIKILTFCDHFEEHFRLFGKSFFDSLPDNNYLLYPIWDAQKMDHDKILVNSTLEDRLFFIPFMPCIEELQNTDRREDYNVYTSDISIMLRYKEITFYYWMYGINEKTFLGRMLMPFLAELVLSVRYELRQNESAYMDTDYIERLVLSAMERWQIVKNIRDFNKFLKYWVNEVRESIISVEYGNCIVDWILERDYNVRLYGGRWKEKEKYKNYAFGEIPDGSDELRKAYQASKISIGTNICMGLHRRVFEAMESDCLCLQAEAHPDWMLSDWRHCFEEGKHIVIFRNKTELYQKIDYFLSHDNERRKITAAAKERLKTCPDIGELLGDVIMKVYTR